MQYFYIVCSNVNYYLIQRRVWTKVCCMFWREIRLRNYTIWYVFFYLFFFHSLSNETPLTIVFVRTFSLLFFDSRIFEKAIELSLLLKVYTFLYEVIQTFALTCVDQYLIGLIGSYFIRVHFFIFHFWLDGGEGILNYYNFFL